MAACSSAITLTATPAEPATSPTTVPAPASPTLTVEPALPTPMPAPTPSPEASNPDTGTSPPRSIEDLGIVTFSTAGWETNFFKHSVDYNEIVQAQAKDGIRSIDNPSFDDFAAVSDWLEDQIPVLAVELNGDARAYPLGILIWHEIVNDTIGGVPVAVTYCPLCNTAIVMKREVNGQLLEFGVSGNLRNSDLIMYDRQTDSWWQQITGEAIVGDLLGTQLEFVAAAIVSYGDFRDSFPEGRVLSRDTGFPAFQRQPYGVNPYILYDNPTRSPFLFFGDPDPRLPTMERVVGLVANGTAKAYSFQSLQEQRVIHDELGGWQVVVFWKPGTTSALDDNVIATSRDVGATGAFDPNLDGARLSFEAQGEGFVDRETGSVWDIFGRAVSGPLEGKRLEPVFHTNHFWFAWAAFSPDTLIYGQ